VAAQVTADVFESLSNFFDSPIWSVLQVLIALFIILMWLALGVWVYRDARRRNAAPGYPRLMAAIGVIIPFFGPLLYMAVRPGETLSEQRDRQLETRSLEREAALECPDCGYPTEARYLACPSCMRKLKDPCAHCGEALDPRWAVCPFCEKVPAGTLNRVTGTPVGARADMPTELSADMPKIRPEPAQ
jgi:hypothetical protein